MISVDLSKLNSVLVKELAWMLIILFVLQFDVIASMFCSKPLFLGEFDFSLISIDLSKLNSVLEQELT